MKILLLISSLGSGGAERQLVTLGLLMRHEGLDVEYLVYHDDPFYEYLLIEQNIKVHKILHENYFIRLFKIRRFIRKSAYAVVVSFLEVPNFINCFSAIGGKNWKVVTAERSAKECTFLSGRGKVFAWFQRFSDAIVCNSDNAKTMWAYHYPQYKSKLSVIYNTVKMPDISINYTPKKSGRFHLVVAASYQYLKNPVGLIQALLLMTPEQRSLLHIDWYGRKEIVSGDTRAYDEAALLINTHKLEATLTLHDETRDIANKMAAADAIGLFSELEGLPNTICEAMVLGKPVVMTKVSDFSILIDESHGFLCEWNDSESIKNTIIEISNLSKDELVEMGKNSFLKAQKLFSTQTILEKWFLLFTVEK